MTRSAAMILALLLLSAVGPLRAVVPRALSTVDMIVQRGDRALVTGVAPGDLQIRVRGTSATIEHIEPVARPVSVLLLVDMSLSAAASGPTDARDDWDPQGIVAALETGFAKQLPSGDRARVGWFAGGTVLMDAGYHSDRSAVARAIREILIAGRPSFADAYAASPMVDAVARGVDHLRGEAGTRAILVISDGESSGNRFSVDDVVRRAVAAGVAVHSMLDAPAAKERLGITASRYPKTFDQGHLLKQIAESTGGIYSRDERFTKSSWGFSMATPAFDYFFKAMHSSLRITISGPSVQPGAELEVIAKDPTWIVSAPRWVPGESPAN